MDAAAQKEKQSSTGVSSPTRGTKNAYAKHRKRLGLRGGTHTAVHKTLQTGRISLDPDGLIDFARADRDWAANTRNSGGAAAAHTPARRNAPASPGVHSGSSTLDLQNEILRLKCAREEIELAQAAGELTDAAEVKAQVHTLMRDLRDQLRAIPSRLRNAVAAERDPHQCAELLRTEIHGVLEGVSEIGGAAEASHAA